MLRGLFRLTWIEIKIFLREPLGAFGAVGVPVLVFLVVGRLLARRPSAATERFLATDLPVFAAILISLSSVLSLVTIISIYREGGILKRLRATPLTPVTILTAHVLVKLLLTLVTLLLLVAAGRQYGIGELRTGLPSFAAALLIATLSVLSLGFLIASLVPTARFAQPLGAVLLYPMLALSGLFFPLDQLPPLWRGVAHSLPLTHAVTLLRGVWSGGGWLDSWTSLLALGGFFLLFTAASQRLFRWE